MLWQDLKWKNMASAVNLRRVIHKKAWTSIVKRPRRSAVLMLCAPSWSIPR